MHASKKTVDVETLEYLVSGDDDDGPPAFRSDRSASGTAELVGAPKRWCT